MTDEYYMMQALKEAKDKAKGAPPTAAVPKKNQ